MEDERMERSSKFNYGSAMVSRGLLASLEALWNGPLRPCDLPRIEQALRAFLLADKLIPSHDTEAIVPYNDGKKIAYFEYVNPFNDHLLDYEFVQADDEFFVADLPEVQTSVLTQTTKQWVGLFTNKILEEELKEGRLLWSGYSSAGEFCKHDRNDWLTTYRVKDSINAQSFASTEIYTKTWDFIYSEPILNYALDEYHESHHAENLGNFFGRLQEKLYKAIDYNVSCHRSGMIVFTDDLPGDLCKEFVFSKWPNELFKSLDQDYSTLMRQLRGPSMGIELPPLILIVLSLANKRDDIPQTIVELRDAYAKSRNNLWLLLTNMWEAPTLKEQIDILNTLQCAAKGILPSIGGRNFNYLSLGLDLAQLSLGGVASAGQKLLAANDLEKKVSAVSFAKQVSSDLKDSAINVKKVIERHLSDSEKAAFGY